MSVYLVWETRRSNLVNGKKIMGGIHPVILCGGSGTRLWPRSRRERPKPFLPLVGRRSLFEQTLERVANPAVYTAPTVVSGEVHRDLVTEQLNRTEGARRIEEPLGRNTAPAIALAALLADQDDILLVCPSDHYIEDTVAFTAAVETAAALAGENWLVALGLEAVSPETGYGYIKRGERLGGGYAVERFVEKPDLATARQFVADGGYSWNGGIFCLRAGTFLKELVELRPEMAAALRAAVEHGRHDDDGIFHPDAETFANIEGESIDYAVMEGTGRAAMVQVAMGWSDIGNWQALRDVQKRDGDGNVGGARKGGSGAELVDCTDTMVLSDGPRVSAIGLDDIIIVVDGDEVLVTTADGAQKVGTLKGASQQ